MVRKTYLPQDIRKRLNRAQELITNNPEYVKIAFQRAKNETGGHPLYFIKTFNRELEEPIRKVLKVVLNGLPSASYLYFHNDLARRLRTWLDDWAKTQEDGAPLTPITCVEKRNMHKTSLTNTPEIRRGAFGHQLRMLAGIPESDL